MIDRLLRSKLGGRVATFSTLDARFSVSAIVETRPPTETRECLQSIAAMLPNRR